MSEFVAYLHELLHDFGSIQSRRMFGGHGIYHQGLMFALVADDSLYFKTDDENRDAFLAVGAQAFSYQSQGEQRSIAYYSAPDECFDDPAEAARWARLAYAAALRAQAKAQQKGAKKRAKKAPAVKADRSKTAGTKVATRKRRGSDVS